ncbi:MAG: glycosyltransferase [Ginsengibacter sp.]
MIEKGISTIIPNYNGRLLLEVILPPLIVSLTNSGLKFEVIVVDDCSSDDSISFLEQDFERIKIIKNRVNKGFSYSMNKGINASQFSLLFFLNSDVIVTPAYFETQLPYFEKPDTFGVMGRMIGWEDDHIQDGGKYPYFELAKIKTSGNYIPADSAAGQKLYSMYLSGANALVSRQKVLLLNGFDEIYSPFYVEDYDLSLRAWRLDWKCYYDHFAVCRHKISVSIKSAASKKHVAKIYNRNKMILHAIHLHGVQKVFWFMQLLLEAIFRTITFQWYYTRALWLFGNNAKNIENSKKAFEAVSFKQGKNNSVREVVTFIRTSLATKNISRF